MGVPCHTRWLGAARHTVVGRAYDGVMGQGRTMARTPSTQRQDLVRHFQEQREPIQRQWLQQMHARALLQIEADAQRTF